VGTWESDWVSPGPATGPVGSLLHPIRTRHLRGDDTRLNTLNKVLMETIQAEGAAFLSNTTLRGRFVLRACAALQHDGRRRRRPSRTPFAR